MQIKDGQFEAGRKRQRCSIKYCLHDVNVNDLFQVIGSACEDRLGRKSNQIKSYRSILDDVKVIKSTQL